MRELPAIIVQGTRKRLAQARPWLPTQFARDLAVVGIVIADIDLLPVARKCPHLELAAAVDLHEQSRQLAQRHRRRSAEIEYLALRFAFRRSEQEGLDGIVDKREV